MPTVGPQLPPHLTEKRKRDKGEDDDSASSTSQDHDNDTKRARVIGPDPPPVSSDERPTGLVPSSANDDNSSISGSDDDDFGPALPTAKDAARTTAGPTHIAQPQSTAPSKRDDWMTMAPTNDDWSARVDPTKLKSRKFGNSKNPAADAGSGDAWHETPEQKQERLRREVLGIKDDSKRKAVGLAPPLEDPEAEATRQRIKEYNNARGPSLYQSHTTKSEEKDDDPSARAFDREKDIGGGSQINSTQRRDMMRKASDFNSRFSSAKYL